MKRILSALVLATLFLVSTGLALSAAPAKYNESPILKDQVAKGQLPPVEKRLPDEPFVVGPGVIVPVENLDFTVGKYGGTLRLANTSAWVNEALFMLEPVLRPNNPVGSKGAKPAMVSAFVVSPDNKKFTFTIRKGIKWSDGQPLTTEDIRFLFQDVYSNPDSKVPWPAGLRTLGRPDGDVPKWAITDQYTFTLTYTKPYGYLAAGLSSWIWGYTSVFQPSAYLKQFHAKYTSMDKIKPLLKENMKDWGDLFATKVISQWGMIVDRNSLGVPVLTAFVPSEFTQDHIVWTRNPYFWMVDTAGNQLPYFDSVESVLMSDMEAVKMRVISGNVDFALYPALSEMSLYLQNQKQGNFTILNCGTINNATQLALNQDFEYDKPDSTWQKIIGDATRRKGFGNALAVAIDHNEVNKSLYFGKQGLPTTTPSEYNPAKAKQLLDSIGMNKMDSEGFRLGPDGKRFELAMTITTYGGDPTIVPTAELLTSYFQKVGIRTSAKTIENNLWNQLASSNQIMASVVWSDGPMWPGGISRDYQPNAKGMWAPASATYFNSNGKSGRKPPAYLQQFFDLDMARNEFVPGSAAGEASFKNLMKWFSDNYVYIWPTEKTAAIRIVSNRLGNVPKQNLPWDRIDYTFEQLYVK